MQISLTSWPYSYIIRASVASSDIAYGAYNGNNIIFWSKKNNEIKPNTFTQRPLHMTVIGRITYVNSFFPIYYTTWRGAFA